MFEAASSAGGHCELSGEADLAGQILYLKACRKQARADQWVMGYGFTIDAILNEDNEQTPLEVIDAIFPSQPVVLMEQTSHSMWVNSAALNAAGFNHSTPDPQGGAILKDDFNGELSGILLDNAGDIVMELAWNSLQEQFEQSYEGLITGLEEAAAHGITTIGDGRMYWKRGWFDVWQEAQRTGDLTARVSVRPWIYPADGMKSQLEYLKSIYSNDEQDRLLVNQVKLYSDGILVNGTAKMLAPYLETYLPKSPYGLNYIEPKAMTQWLQQLEGLGYSAHIHAIGDSAVRESLDAIAEVRRRGSDKPYTLTHVELVNPKDVARFHQLNVTADFQVGSDYVAYHDHQWAKAFIGAKRAQALMNLRVLFDAKANVTLSSDWNVHDINPLVGIANSVIMGKTGFPDVTSAIDAYTINAAYSLGIEAITGSLQMGKSADFAIVEQDITQIPVDQIAETEILMTVLQGEVVFDSSERL